MQLPQLSTPRVGRSTALALALVGVLAGCAASNDQVDTTSSDDEALVADLGGLYDQAEVPDDQVLPDAELATSSDDPGALQLQSVSPSGAIAWYSRRAGSRAYEHYCELAAERSYGRSGVYRSAIVDWNTQVARGRGHKGNLHPPKGALVFWRTSVNGHVGVADGAGGFWATSVGGKIGHARLPYYRNYLGWAPSPF